MIGIVRQLSALSLAIRENTEQRKNEFAWHKSHVEFVTKQDLIEMEKRMADQLDDIIADIEEQKTLISGVSTLVTGLKDQLKDALSGVSLPPAVQAKIAKIWTETEANRQALADALVENTPAAPEPPAPPA